MSLSDRKSNIYVEDTLRRTEDDVLGVVIRTWHDLEQHIDALPLSEGEFEINWLDDFGAYGEKKLANQDIVVNHEDFTGSCALLDRSFGLGDAVKKDSSSAMSGIVQGGSMQIQIRNLATRELHTCTGQDVVVESERVQIGDYLVHEPTEWVGIVKSMTRRTLVKFYSGELALCDEVELCPVQYSVGNIFYPDLLPSTTLVKVSKTGVKEAEYLSGAYSRELQRYGVVCTSFICRIEVDWQFQNMMVATYVPVDAPSKHISCTVDSDIEDFGLRTANLLDGSFSHQIGDIVRLKGELPYSATFQEFTKFTVEERRKACKDWEILLTKQSVTVKWQDGSTSVHPSVDLVPYLNVDDLDLWPSDHVVNKANGDKGIIQTCNAEQRIAVVQWEKSQEPREESLYDLMTDGDFNVDLGDLVLIVPADGHVHQEIATEETSWGPAALYTSISSTISRYLPPSRSLEANDAKFKSDRPTNGVVSWLGQLISVELDGTCLVALCFATDPSTIRVPIARLVHLASTDSASSHDSDTSDDTEFDMSSSDYDSEAYSMDEPELDMQDSTVVWMDEEGQSIVDYSGDSGEWEDDASMEDFNNTETIDVLGEDITEPERADIILDVLPESRPVEDHLPSSNNLSTTQLNIGERTSEVGEAAIPVTIQADFFPVSHRDFLPFAILECDPVDHAFYAQEANARSSALKRISQEYNTLATSLPPGILVRAFESRMDLLRVLIIGASGTPYEYAPMVFDVYMSSMYPEGPPTVHFYSWTNGVGKVNPNLYEDGKVCLSLLGTWHGTAPSETWTPRNSSLLQIFVSLQALVLVREPYYNEAGYDALSAHDTAVAAANYRERAFVLTRGFIAHLLGNPMLGLVEEVQWLYRGSPGFLSLALAQAEAVIAKSEMATLRDTLRDDERTVERDESVVRVSKGALLLLKRIVTGLRSIKDA